MTFLGGSTSPFAKMTVVFVRGTPQKFCNAQAYRAKSAPARNDRSAWHEGEAKSCRVGQSLLTDGIEHLDAFALASVIHALELSEADHYN